MKLLKALKWFFGIGWVRVFGYIQSGRLGVTKHYDVYENKKTGERRTVHYK